MYAYLAGKKARKSEPADVQMEKGEVDGHLKSLTKPRTIIFYTKKKYLYLEG